MRTLLAILALATTASAQTVVPPPTHPDLQLATDYALCSGTLDPDIGFFGSFVLEAPATEPDTLWLVTHSITPTALDVPVAWYLGDTAFFPPSGTPFMGVTCLEAPPTPPATGATVLGLGRKYMHSVPSGNNNVWASIPRPTDPAIVGSQWFVQPVYTANSGLAAGRGWAITL